VSLKFDKLEGSASQGTSVAGSDDQKSGRPTTPLQLISRAPFPSAVTSAPAMHAEMDTVDYHGPHSFDLIPLPRRGNATHGPQSFDLIPLPHRGNATPPMRARLPSSIAPAPWMRQGQGGASAGEYALTGPPGGRSLGVTGSTSMLGLAPVVMGVSQPLRSVGRRGGAV
jgi:hypothetical protein